MPATAHDNQHEPLQILTFLVDLRPLAAAAKATIHDFPGSAAGLVTTLRQTDNRYKKAPHTLLNEVNANSSQHKLGLFDSVLFQLASNDYRMLHAQCAALSHVAVPLGDFSGVSDVELLEAYANWHADIGMVAKEMAEAFADRRVTSPEFLILKELIYQTSRTGMELLSRLEAVVDDG